MRQDIDEVERAIRIYEDVKRQVKTFSEQGEIGVKIAQGILKDCVLKDLLTIDMAEMIALELKI